MPIERLLCINFNHFQCDIDLVHIECVGAFFFTRNNPRLWWIRIDRQPDVLAMSGPLSSAVSEVIVPERELFLWVLQILKLVPSIAVEFRSRAVVLSCCRTLQLRQQCQNGWRSPKIVRVSCDVRHCASKGRVHFTLIGPPGPFVKKEATTWLRVVPGSKIESSDQRSWKFFFLIQEATTLDWTGSKIESTDQKSWRKFSDSEQKNNFAILTVSTKLDVSALFYGFEASHCIWHRQ